MKKKLFVFIGLMLIACIIGTTISHAWYIRRYKTQPIDASTTGIVFSYQVDDRFNNVKTLDIENIAFFDKTAPKEGQYLGRMAFIFKVTLRNECRVNIDIEINQKMTGVDMEAAHIESAIATKDFTVENDDVRTGVTTVADYLEKNSMTDITTDKYVIESLAPQDTADIYVYVYGINPVALSNNDYLSATYSYVLAMTAIKEE